MQKDVREENIVEAKEQVSIEVQVVVQQATYVQAMEMERCELEDAAKKRLAILDKVTLLEKSIKIPNPHQFMCTQTKQNYDKHVERMEKQKDIVEGEDWASKLELVFLFMMDG